MIGAFGLLLLATSTADFDFHNWCDKVGIKTPQARLQTTTKSVAGRGVFAEGEVQEGDVVIRIPEHLVLHEFNGEQSFPDLAKFHQEIRQNYDLKINSNNNKSTKKRWWRRLFSRKKSQGESKNEDIEDMFLFVTSEDFWQAELTNFALASLTEDNHIWAPWIEQWQRSDPMQSMFEKGISWRDNRALSEGVKELHRLLPDVPEYKLKAAAHIRLGRMDELKQLYGLSDNDLALYGTLISRAVEIGDGILAVIPMFDMINHSRNPNLGLHFNGKEFGLCALRDIKDGEEFFISYNKSPENSDGTWDEDSAVWNVVQWGIPEQRPALVPQESLI